MQGFFFFLKKKHHLTIYRNTAPIFWATWKSYQIFENKTYFLAWINNFISVNLDLISDIFSSCSVAFFDLHFDKHL